MLVIFYGWLVEIKMLQNKDGTSLSELLPFNDLNNRQNSMGRGRLLLAIDKSL